MAKTSAWPTLMRKAYGAGFATATSNPRRQLICTPAFPPRRCFVSVVVVGGLAVSRQDRLLPPDDSRITDLSQSQRLA